jgi:hypothetical protein
MRTLRIAGLLACGLVSAVIAQPAAPPAPPPAPRPAPGPAAPALSAQQWRADLAFLARTLPQRHPKPFTRVTHEQWQAAVGRLDARIPALAPDEIAVGIASLVALLGDAHTIAYASDMPPGFHVLPIRLFWFADGLHVVAAAKGNESLLGLPLTSVGEVPIQDAVAAVTPTFVHENEALQKTGAAAALTTVEILHAMGLIHDPSQVTLGFGPATAAGGPRITLTPLAGSKDVAWVRWPDHAGAPTPLARSRPQSWYWRQRIDSSAVLFIQYNRCQDSPGQKVADFVRETLAEIDARPPRAVVVDLRYNGGGSSSLLMPLIRGLSGRKAINAPDRLFVLIGRVTFSSALMNAVSFRQLTKATLVGESTGGKPNHFGETRTFTLPNSGMTIQHSTKYFREQEKDEDALHPDVRVDLRAADYGAGRDPVMDEVLRRAGGGR